MTVRMPRRVRVGSTVYDITRGFDPDELDDEIVQGYCDVNAKSIVLEPYLPPQQARKVLLHEIEHAIFDEANLNDHISPITDRKQEAIIVATTPVRLSVLRNNPALIRYLTERS